jgi:intein/homing endonuclease
MMKYQFGKLPARPDAIELKLGDVLNASKLPTPPKSFGHVTSMPNGNWFMLGNDQKSNCTIAGGNHEHMLWTMAGGVPRARFTTRDSYSDYFALTGGDDSGLDMQTVCSYRQKIGLLDATGVRHKIDAYADLNPGDLDQLALAAWLFGAAGVGVSCPSSMQDQFENGEPWSVVAGDTIKGGHYIPCLHGDTLISLLDGREISIRDLAESKEDQWVYAIDANQRVVPALATNIRKTGEGRSLVRVTLDDGGTFDCTEDHLIMMRDGSYVEAAKMTAGDSLMPLYRRPSDGSYHKMKGYEEFLDPHSEEWVFTHWRVTEEAIGRRWGVIHHKNGKRNNDPRQLERMRWSDHRALHAMDRKTLSAYAKSEEGREISRALMAKSWSDDERRKKHIDHLKTNEKIKAHRKAGFFDKNAQSRNGKKTGHLNIKFAHSPEGERKSAEAVRKRYATDPVALAKAQERARINGAKAASPEAIAKRLATWHRNREIANKSNHKIASVTAIEGLHDVYDMEVPKYHNFAISAGVFVHNCVGRNSAGNFLFITWGRLHAATPGWVQTYMDEGVCYLSLEIINTSTKLSPEGFNPDTLTQYLRGFA